MLTMFNPRTPSAMEGNKRAGFIVLVAFVILASVYFYNEQNNAFKYILKTRRPLYSLPAIKAKQSFVASQTGDKAVGKCDKECSRFQDLARNWD